MLQDHRVPPDFKSKKKTGEISGGMREHAGAGQNSDGFRPYANNTVAAAENQFQGYFFTEEEYSQLMSLLNKPSPSDNNTKMAGIASLLSNSYACE